MLSLANHILSQGGVQNCCPYYGDIALIYSLWEYFPRN